ncbi:hypothetical protein L1987_84943 [Smallanthus sonchifolius]|uniref:Uncharacterized protein n=1 Tax=Smallanthus sonchifolius TaxID=185202 RepID=A0ACB8XUJ5_9ASTR|nr:hypothetical protein L1987_84943 [Smallanthus sonchifolius]
MKKRVFTFGNRSLKRHSNKQAKTLLPFQNSNASFSCSLPLPLIVSVSLHLLALSSITLQKIAWPSNTSTDPKPALLFSIHLSHIRSFRWWWVGWNDGDGGTTETVRLRSRVFTFYEKEIVGGGGGDGGERDRVGGGGRRWWRRRRRCWLDGSRWW